MKIFFLLLINISFLFSIEIYDVTQTHAKISMKNLKQGQSGIVVKTIDDNSLIITQAIITQSTNIDTTIKFIDNKVLQQDAIPTTKLTPSNGDNFVLNHLYTTSLLIVPNQNAKNKLIDLYPSQNFLSEDFFASHLKLEGEPVPSKEIIMEFAQSQEIGTIFIVVSNKLYILDSLTFKIINKINLNYTQTKPVLPFLTKIKDIQRPFWNFGDEKIENYNDYYLKLMEIK